MCIRDSFKTAMDRANNTHMWTSVIFVNENENENGEKRENYEFINEN